MKLHILIKKVSEELNLPLDYVNSVIRYGFTQVSKEANEGAQIVYLQHIGSFKRKMSARDRTKKHLEYENNKNKQQ